MWLTAIVVVALIGRPEWMSRARSSEARLSAARRGRRFVDCRPANRPGVRISAPGHQLTECNPLALWSGASGRPKPSLERSAAAGARTTGSPQPHGKRRPHNAKPRAIRCSSRCRMARSPSVASLGTARFGRITARTSDRYSMKNSGVSTIRPRDAQVELKDCLGP